MVGGSQKNYPETVRLQPLFQPQHRLTPRRVKQSVLVTIYINNHTYIYSGRVGTFVSTKPFRLTSIPFNHFHIQFYSLFNIEQVYFKLSSSVSFTVYLITCAHFWIFLIAGRAYIPKVIKIWLIQKFVYLELVSYHLNTA